MGSLTLMKRTCFASSWNDARRNAKGAVMVTRANARGRASNRATGMAMGRDVARAAMEMDSAHRRETMFAAAPIATATENSGRANVNG